ncbi:MAG: hypothetical protein JSR82_19230 [Verrucomicrobia bacterium]|nr:hypothetical protein [Verrucomicrobiota bacterium]
MKSLLSSCTLLLGLSLDLRAGASADYLNAPEAVSALGGHSSSAAYRNVASAGGIAGVSSSPGGVAARQGFIGQLFERVGLALESDRTFVGEGTQANLFAKFVYDDGTTDALPSGSVLWSVLGGPIASITAAGIATAGQVYLDSTGVVQGQFDDLFATLPLTIVNTHNDNFGGYAGDGLDDAWQVQYFGLNNPNASPTVDVNGTGQNNAFKFQAGLDPTAPAGSANARFVVTAAAVAGQPAQRQISFRPLVVGRSYRVQYTTSLASGSTWADLTGFTQLPDVGDTRTIIDQNATEGRRFYRVEIVKTPTSPGPTGLDQPR